MFSLGYKVVRGATFVLLAGLVVLSLTSCSLLINGRQQLVPFQSQPEGAEVWIDGEFKGITPIEVNLRRGEQRHVALLKLGDAEQTVILERGLTSTSATGLIIEAAAGGAAIVVGAAFSDPNATVIDAAGALSVAVFLPAAISVVVDLSTGSYYQLEPGEVFVEFE